MKDRPSTFEMGLIFPGQGSQYVGMGKRIAQEFSIARETFSEADHILGCALSELCFQGSVEELVRTENCQPAVLAVSVAHLRVLQQEGIMPDVVAGHSLGEYTGLVCAGVLSFEDALRLVRKRGIFMERAVPRGKGAMAAILGMDEQAVEEICRRVSSGKVLAPANFNCPGQVVVSGETEAIEDVFTLVNQKYGSGVIKLQVSGPFHCSLMKSAAEALREALENVRFRRLEIPIITNVDARVNFDKNRIAEKLIEQMTKPVLWHETLKRMMTLGVRTIVEVGPNRKLLGFIKKLKREVATYCTDDSHSFEELLSRKRG